MSHKDVVKILVNKPFSLKPHEIAQLTPWQVRHLYLCERNENGEPALDYVDDDTPTLTYKSLFFKNWRNKGLREDLIEQLWNEQNGRLDDG